MDQSPCCYTWRHRKQVYISILSLMSGTLAMCMFVEHWTGALQVRLIFIPPLKCVPTVERSAYPPLKCVQFIGRIFQMHNVLFSECFIVRVILAKSIRSFFTALSGHCGEVLPLAFSKTEKAAAVYSRCNLASVLPLYPYSHCFSGLHLCKRTSYSPEFTKMADKMERNIRAIYLFEGN